MRILASDGLDKSAVTALTAKGHEVVEQFYEPAELANKVKEFDVLIVRSATKVRKPIIDAAKETGRLKMVIRGGVGVDNIDVEYAEANGIQVKNTPRASSNTVAELALAHMLGVARFISVAGHSMREDRWDKNEYKGIELAGRTLGIIGCGRIGQMLAEKAQALGMKVIANDIYHCPGLECDTFRYGELDELLANSDFISLHTPCLDGKPLINEETIAKMKDGAVIINTSRGNNVDEDALLAALNSGKLRGAGLDVFAEEPSKNHALYSHPHVSCTPHIGAQTSEAQKRVGGEIVDIICAM